MNSSFDVAIIGAGTMGSAAAFFLAQAGLRVLVLEQFRIAHEFGSHSGATRIIRHAYHESPDYVPLVLRSDHLWQELEQRSNAPLLIRTGGIDLGPKEGKVVANAELACRTHSLPFEHMEANEIMQRWPQFRIPANWHACFDPNMGFLLVDNCIHAYADAARKTGAEIHEEETVLSYHTKTSISITTTKTTYSVQKVVVSAGAWNTQLLRDLALPLVVKRRTLSWLKTENDEFFRPGNFPIFLADTPAGLLYGFPVYGKPGLKMANHHERGPETDPDTVDRIFHPEDALDAQEFASKFLVGVHSTVIDAKICLYTMTPDEHFVIDLHPRNPNIVVAAGFSGHGFKFAPVVGEILRDLAINQHTDHPISKFRINRFLKQ